MLLSDQTIAIILMALLSWYVLLSHFRQHDVFKEFVFGPFIFFIYFIYTRTRRKVKENSL